MTKRQIDSDSVAALASRLIRETMLSDGVKMPEARKIVARRLGVLPGTLERLVAGRLKYVEWVAGRINDYLGARLAREADEIERNLQLYLQTGGAADPVEIDRVQRLLDEARRALGK